MNEKFIDCTLFDIRYCTKSEAENEDIPIVGFDCNIPSNFDTKGVVLKSNNNYQYWISLEEFNRRFKKFFNKFESLSEVTDKLKLLQSNLENSLKNLKSDNGLTFNTALDYLMLGSAMTRSSWSDRFIFRELKFDFNSIRNKQDLITIILDNIKSNKPEFKSRLMLIDESDNITEWTPSTEDLFTNDWKLISITK